MNSLAKKYTSSEFDAYVQSVDLGETVPGRVILHQYRSLSPKFWKGDQSIAHLQQHFEALGWPSMPHIVICEDQIWLTESLAKVGCHAGLQNATWIRGEETLRGYYYEDAVLQDYSIGVMLVGDYDRDQPSKTLQKSLDQVLSSLQKRLAFAADRIQYYRDHAPVNAPGINFK